jgi:hypothetical protein
VFEAAGWKAIIFFWLDMVSSRLQPAFDILPQQTGLIMMND